MLQRIDALDANVNELQDSSWSDVLHLPKYEWRVVPASCTDAPTHEESISKRDGITFGVLEIDNATDQPPEMLENQERICLILVDIAG